MINIISKNLIEISSDLIVSDEEIQKYCKLAYPGHKDGCLNYGKKNRLNGIRSDLKSRIINDCPPGIPLINEIFEFSKSLYIIYTEFELGKNAERLFQNGNHKKPEHCYNMRFWQETARKELRQQTEKFLDSEPNTIVDLTPEAHGVNLYHTMKNLGITIPWYKPWPPAKHSIENITFRVALGGFPLNPKE